MKALLATLAPLAVLGLLAAPAAARAPQDEVPPIQEEGDFYILNFSEDTEQALSLEDFVKLCQEATSLNFTYTKTTADDLGKATVVMLGMKRIAKRDFYAFFQIQMFINEFICIEVGPPRIRLIMIQGLSGTQGRGGGARPVHRALYVPPDEVEDYEDAPATLITTSLYLPNTEVRQLSTSMRTMLADQNTQLMIPVGDHAVILSGFGSQVAAQVKLLTLVDSMGAVAPLPQAVFDVMPLEHAAAEDVADLIDQLIEAQARSAPAPGGGRQRGPDGQPITSQALGGGNVEPQVLVDARTNSLLIMALPDEMPRIKDLIARLDIEVLEPERNFHIYDLQHMQAKELADTLDEFLSGAQSIETAQGGTGGRARPSGGGGGSRTSNEVVVVADETANALLIAANKTRYEEVLDLIRQLDRRQDQVLIETALIELTGTDFRDIGIELAFADTAGDGGFLYTGFGLSTLEDLIGDDGIPDTRVPGVPGTGLVGGILSGDNINLPFLIAAAQQTSGANVLNVPSVLVNNNGSATVTTLDEQPTTTVTLGGGVGGTGTQENFREYEEAGIILEISPSISASNYLRLDVSLVVQTFTGSGQTSGNQSIPPPRVTREIRTTVNVPDGDTMVIGGIITDNVIETSRGIPWLMDLPLLGALFRRKSRTNARTTLYFFVTPHILRDRDFADLAEISYQRKQDAAQAIGPDRVRMIDPDFDADENRLDESFQIPTYHGPERGEVSDPEAIGLDAQRRNELLREHREQQAAEESGQADEDSN